jgi:hypothetical protein
MDRVRVLGAGLTLVGLAGYGAGTAIAYEGRALSLTAVMVGLTLVTIGGGE